ncbi:hypothetical protein Mapa_005854 [Marchantia paleacea]|nr:hypothetical protein Mapa_005854 [Marchantia paleacea]
MGSAFGAEMEQRHEDMTESACDRNTPTRHLIALCGVGNRINRSVFGASPDEERGEIRTKCGTFLY